MDVQGGRDREMNNVQIWKKNGSKAQKWTIIYQDKADRRKSKGLNKHFGFEINRPFYIRSRMPMQRMVTSNGNNIYLSDYKEGNTAQQFYFDEKSKTLRSQKYKIRSTNKALNIGNHGRGYNLDMSSPTSRWW